MVYICIYRCADIIVIVCIERSAGAGVHVIIRVDRCAGAIASVEVCVCVGVDRCAGRCAVIIIRICRCAGRSVVVVVRVGAGGRIVVVRCASRSCGIYVFSRRDRYSLCQHHRR